MLLTTRRPLTGTAGPATVLSDAMAVLWFIHADAMYGFPAYELPVSDIIRKLGGEAYFKFLCRLDQAPELLRVTEASATRRFRLPKGGVGPNQGSDASPGCAQAEVDRRKKQLAHKK